MSWARAKISARRGDFPHGLSDRLAARHRLIPTERLAVRNMTASARGTVGDPGRNVAQEAGLNRSILDAAPQISNRCKMFHSAANGGTGTEDRQA